MNATNLNGNKSVNASKSVNGSASVNRIARVSGSDVGSDMRNGKIVDNGNVAGSGSAKKGGARYAVPWTARASNRVVRRKLSRKSGCQADRAVLAVNMIERRDSDNVCSYAPVAGPRCVAPEGYEPIVAMDSEYVVVADNGSVGLIDRNGGQVAVNGGPAGRPDCGVTLDGGRTLLMAGEEGVYDVEAPLCKGGEGTCLPVGTGQPQPITIVAEPSEPVEVIMESVTLSREYGPGAITERVDCELLQRRLAACYARAAAEASDFGVWIQPVMARAVCRDDFGSVTYCGPQLLVMPPEGPQFMDAVELPLNPNMRNVTQQVVIRVPTFKLKAMVERDRSEQALRTVVLEIETSPQLHPWCEEARTVYRGKPTVVRRGGSTGGETTSVMVTLPEVARGLNTASVWPESVAKVEKLTAFFDKVCKEAARVLGPYDKNREIYVRKPSELSFENEVELIEAVMAKQNDSEESESRRLAAMCNAPNRFSARLGASCADKVVWSDITAYLFGGYSAAALASAVLPEWGWSARTTVKFADGSRATSITHGTRNAPSALGPVVAYPDIRAVEMEVVVAVESHTPMRWVYSLKPDVSGQCAVSVEPRMASTAGSEYVGSDISAEESETVKVRMPGVVLVATGRRPLDVNCARKMPGAVTAVWPISTTMGGWNFGRSRFAVFTAQEVLQINVSIWAKDMAMAHLGTTGVDNRNAVAAGPDGTVYFISGGRYVYTLRGGKLAVLKELSSEVDRIVYDYSERLLTVGKSSGMEYETMLHVKPWNGAMVCVSTGMGPSDRWLSTPDGRVLVGTQDGLLDLSL